ncbi:hypothetical protein AXW85_33415 [Pseudomonas aeruginosa]|nr:hypothetical protein AXW85_33415 [Pseudomonas aeruginosa]
MLKLIIKDSSSFGSQLTRYLLGTHSILAGKRECYIILIACMVPIFAFFKHDVEVVVGWYIIVG